MKSSNWSNTVSPSSHTALAHSRAFPERQETRRAQEYALEFRTLAAGAGWNNRALIAHYHCSLHEDIRLELAFKDTTLTFDQLVDLSIRLDNMLATRGLPDWCLVVPSSRIPSPIPMELGGMERRETRGVFPSCTICGRRGHTAGRCQFGSSGNRDSRQGALALPQVSWHHSHPESSVAHMFLSVTFPEFSPHSQHKALVDSGAAGNFIARALAHSLGITIVPLDVPFPIHALDCRAW